MAENHRTDRRPTWILIASAVLLLIIWALTIYGQFLSRGVHFREHRYNTGDHTVTGRIAGASVPDKYSVVMFFRDEGASDEDYSMPSEGRAIGQVEPDGTFAIEANSPEGENAAYYSLLLVPSGLDITGLNGSEQIWPTLRDEHAIDAVVDVKTAYGKD